MTPSSTGQARRALAAELGSHAEARWLIQEVTQRARDRRATAQSDGPAADVRLGADVEGELGTMVARRLAGEPLQYVIGHWSFRSVELLVDPRVLIPRPETEYLVEVALAEIERSAARRCDLVVADLGTGSGAIALAVAVETISQHPELVVWACDVDQDALEVAQLNHARVSASCAEVAGRVEFVQGSWWRALPRSLRGCLDVVVANPPYVARAEWADLDPEVKSEPYHALVAEDGRDGTPGFGAAEEVLDQAASWLRPSGAVVVEIAPHQAQAAYRAARSAGLERVHVEADLSRRPRVLVAQRPRDP